MWASASDEEKERDIEIDNDYLKARQFSGTIIGRKRFRNMRIFLTNIGINLPIPMGAAVFTHEYAEKYGKVEPTIYWPNS